MPTTTPAIIASRGAELDGEEPAEEEEEGGEVVVVDGLVETDDVGDEVGAEEVVELSALNNEGNT